MELLKPRFSRKIENHMAARRDQLLRVQLHQDSPHVARQPRDDGRRNESSVGMSDLVNLLIEAESIGAA
jgi:hypothetical protein